MSTIVVVRNKRYAAIAADFQSSQGETIVPGSMRVGPGKIHRIGDACMGIVGSIAHQNAIHSLSTAQPELFRLNTRSEIFETLRDIQPRLCTEYFLRTDESADREQEYDSIQMSGLILSKGGIFSFFSHREVTEYTSFWAIGSGAEFALGALHARYEQQACVKALAVSAVETACIFDFGTGPPVECHDMHLAESQD
ncbi:MFS transporter [Botrimarina mediterranea]|uniref:Proteasome subunit beta n=1 Tax=Botrimarina mediterranea TaxID=2528022 RepID=A0A518K8V6_9BACT|nr:MFS transporter [Botrimarina mediterranea]QDV74213.1 Proteasome subunit beta [Botrimarina mediterranea]QDV78844.1 Proteasome subunit beta [Planctomycetes bacterium K2D]